MDTIASPARPASVITVTANLCSAGIVCVSLPPMTTASLWNRYSVAVSVLTSVSRL
ncbi:MAG: hypothetical protein AAF639_36735 [Chloroflexota bacterium]